MDNPETQVIMVTRHRTKTNIKNGQSRNTGNNGHKTQNEDKNNNKGAIKNGQSRNTGNNGHKTQNEDKHQEWTIQKHR